jgi:hypothetical protein
MRMNSFQNLKNKKKSSKENSEEKENQICIQTIKKDKKNRANDQHPNKSHIYKTAIYFNKKFNIFFLSYVIIK